MEKKGNVTSSGFTIENKEFKDFLSFKIIIIFFSFPFSPLFTRPVSMQSDNLQICEQTTKSKRHVLHFPPSSEARKWETVAEWLLLLLLKDESLKVISGMVLVTSAFHYTLVKDNENHLPECCKPARGSKHSAAPQTDIDQSFLRRPVEQMQVLYVSRAALTN